MTSIDLATEPLLAALLDYWERKRDGRPMPRRRDIDALDIPPRLLPHVLLIEPGAGGRLRLRLVGTAIVGAIGKEVTGRHIDEAFDGSVQRFLEEFFGAAFARGRPVSGRSWLRKAKGPDLGSAWLATPLSEDGSAVSMVLAAAAFRFARARTLVAEPGPAEEAIEVL
jgi:hypothetical protein